PGSGLRSRVREAFRILKPLGGVAIIDKPIDSILAAKEVGGWFADAKLDAEVDTNADGVWARITKGRLFGAGEWSHQYGRADNSAYGGELLSWVRATAAMQTQWVGRPGPRYQPDRNGRKPGPLATAGRLFAQGLQRLIAIDAYNGTIIWSVEIPELARFNIPRDSSNWCADSNYVYVVVKDRCWRLDAKDGTLSHQFIVERGSNNDWQYDWGFVASEGDLLLGSATKQDSSYTEFRGHSAWYDQPTGPESFKVCSDNLFAMDKTTGDARWKYADGVIINPTITVGDGLVYFVECRNEKVKAAKQRRIGMQQLWQNQFLVALNVADGKVVWEQPIDTDDGESVFYLAYQNKKLVIVASGNKKFHVSTYDSTNGKLAWEDRFDWPEGAHDHGKAMSRPAMVDRKLFVRPRVYDLATGTPAASVMPGGGCGTYACAGNFLIYRSGNVTLWDHRYEVPSQWSRLRPGCWLSAIPAGGMLLAPEAGGGCSCGNWMETSIGFIPKKARVLTKEK
ncbi:MAG: PQQ-binding-like beta-propeller repeat protein, partial [Planctomycetales bacterium]